MCLYTCLKRIEPEFRSVIKGNPGKAPHAQPENPKTAQNKEAERAKIGKRRDVGIPPTYKALPVAQKETH